MTAGEALLIQYFDAYNRQDIEAFLALSHAEIDWPDQTRGGRFQGHQAMREHWGRNNAIIQVEAIPLALDTLVDGRIRVDVNLVVRNLTGALWSDVRVRQYYTLREGLFSRMDVVPIDDQSLEP
jgi:hypothetical protein